MGIFSSLLYLIVVLLVVTCPYLVGCWLLRCSYTWLVHTRFDRLLEEIERADRLYNVCTQSAFAQAHRYCQKLSTRNYYGIQRLKKELNKERLQMIDGLEVGQRLIAQRHGTNKAITHLAMECRVQFNAMYWSREQSLPLQVFYLLVGPLLERPFLKFFRSSILHPPVVKST